MGFSFPMVGSTPPYDEAPFAYGKVLFPCGEHDCAGWLPCGRRPAVSGRLVAAPGQRPARVHARGELRNCWMPPEGTVFSVRGPTYYEDGVKAPRALPWGERWQWIGCARAAHGWAGGAQRGFVQRVQAEYGEQAPFFMVLNLQVSATVLQQYCTKMLLVLLLRCPFPVMGGGSSVARLLFVWSIGALSLAWAVL